MPSISIAQEPGSGVPMSAYNPIPFVIYANQPTSGDPCPIVYADVYFDGVYYGTFSATIYHAIVGPYAEYHFDIQDKAQEYLRSIMPIVPATTNSGDLLQHHCECYVKFRETDIDVDGFTVSPELAPIGGSFFEDPVDGDGLQSDTFVILNTHQRQIDGVVLLDHLANYTPAGNSGFDYGWNLSHRPNQWPTYSYVKGGGKYWICKEDHDVLAWWTDQDLSTYPTSFLYVKLFYKNGTDADDSILLSALPVALPAGGNLSYFINAGIPFLSSVLTSLTWTNIDHYMVLVGDIFADYAAQMYYVCDNGCCNGRIRIMFQNLLGGWDGINMKLVEEVSKTESSLYQKSKPYISPDKMNRGIGRFQPRQSDVIECYTEDYTEADMPWIKELFGSAQAFIQVPTNPNELEYSQFHPIIILDGEIVSKKKDDTFVYTVSIKFAHANEVINLRS